MGKIVEHIVYKTDTMKLQEKIKMGNDVLSGFLYWHLPDVFNVSTNKCYNQISSCTFRRFPYHSQGWFIRRLTKSIVVAIFELGVVISGRYYSCMLIY